MNAQDHYENHFAPYYSWIYGGFENKSKEAEDFFRANKILPNSNSIAVDLGAGNGFPLKDFDRFIPLAQSENQIFTCILEYDIPGYVRINDLVYVRENTVWKKYLSSYLKLVIFPEIIKENFEKAGFCNISYEKKLGMITIIGAK